MMEHSAQDANPPHVTSTAESHSSSGVLSSKRFDHDAASSLPDSKPYDLSMASHHHASNAGFHQPPPSPGPAQPPRNPLARHMGQSISHGPHTGRPPTTVSTSLSVHLAQTGLIATQKLKRAFGGKRTKSVDLNKAAEDSDNELARTHSKQGSAAKQLTMQFTASMHALAGKKHRSSSASAHTPQSPLPPPVPPKPSSDNGHESEAKTPSATDYFSVQQSSSSVPEPSTSSPEVKTVLEPSTAHDAVAPIPEVTAVVGAEMTTPPTRRRERAATTSEAEDWRKSDSTMHTVRLVGSRTPRPLSLAESTNSGHTVQPSNTPPASRRLSALITDAEFITPEVESEDESVQIVTLPPTDTDDEGLGSYINRRSPTSSSKAHNRRSLAAHLANLSPKGKSQFVDSVMQWSSDSEAFSTVSTGTANSSTTSITSSPSHSDGISAKDAYADLVARQGQGGTTTSSIETSSNHSHMDQPPWVTTTRASVSSISLSTSTSSSKDLPIPPMPASAHPGFVTSPPRGKRVASQSKGFRQTAVTLTSNLAPVAKGLGKRIGRAFAGSSSSISISSSEHSSHGSSRKRDGSSGRWSPRPSIGTTSSQSDTEGGSHARIGPYLGQMIRGPKWHGAGGLVFGRPLRDCVAETAVLRTIEITSRDSIEKRFRNSQSESHLSELGVIAGGRGTIVLSSSVTSTSVEKIVDIRALEERRLPALALRCAQHLVKWGIQEEGLFRVNGRPAHITKIRSEFDSGADFDMSECGPGDIDPHAVASVFKAFLRELPEPLLTRNLNPFFEAAMTAENDLISASLSESSAHDRNLRGLRKPPSLSTLALPTLNMRKHSASLLATLANLIAQLPVENRDLLKTVTELIRATAACSKETKMPLSNLLVVFCPSLTMSPPLLRVLCEGEGIWNGPVEEALGVEAIKKEQEKPSVAKERSEDSDPEDALRVNLRPRSSSKKAPASDTIAPNERNTSPAHSPSSIDKSLPVLPTSRDADTLTSDISTPPLTTTSTATSSPESATLDDDGVSPESQTPSSRARMRKQSDLPLRSVRKSHISGPIPFPLTGSAPTTPVGLKPTLTLSTSSSSPNLGPASASATSPPSASLSRRRTRPSLHDLLPKRSLSSLLSRPLSTFSPIDPPLTAASTSDVGGFSTEPLTRTVSECPVLDIPVMHSPIKMDMEIGDSPFMLGNATTSDASGKRNDVDYKQQESQAQTKKASVETARLRVDMSEATLNRISSTSSTAPTVFYTPLSHPISLTPAPSLGTTGSSDSYSFLDLKFKDAEECENDDWAKSVLMAASTDSGVTKATSKATSSLSPSA